MAQAVAEPEAIKRFASQLRQFSGSTQSQMTVLVSQLNALGDTWRDQEHEKFLTAFNELKIMINRFTEAAQEHIPFLLRKAARIEDYLQQR